jgi:hypothetical protein
LGSETCVARLLARHHFSVGGVIFWLIAGRGIEALLAARSRSLSPAITWVAFGTALLIIICCAILCVGLVIDMNMRGEMVFFMAASSCGECALGCAWSYNRRRANRPVADQAAIETCT